MLDFVLITLAALCVGMFLAYFIVVRDINERRKRSLPHGGIK